MEIATELITNLGFPIAVALLLAAYVRDLLKQTREDTKVIRDDSRVREKELMEANKMFAQVLSESTTILAAAKEQHTEIIDKVDSMDERVRTVEHKIDLIDAKVTRPVNRLE